MPVFMISSNLLMFDYMFGGFLSVLAKTPTYPDSFLTSLSPSELTDCVPGLSPQ